MVNWACKTPQSIKQSMLHVYSNTRIGLESLSIEPKARIIIVDKKRRANRFCMLLHQSQPMSRIEQGAEKRKQGNLCTFKNRTHVHISTKSPIHHLNEKQEANKSGIIHSSTDLYPYNIFSRE